jgi:hypothetical protein
MTSVSVTSGSLLHCLEKHQMYLLRVSPNFCW